MVGRVLLAAHQYLEVRLRASWQRMLAGIGMIVVGLALVAAGVLIGHPGL